MIVWTLVLTLALIVCVCVCVFLHAFASAASRNERYFLWLGAQSIVGQVVWAKVRDDWPYVPAVIRTFEPRGWKAVVSVQHGGIDLGSGVCEPADVIPIRFFPPDAALWKESLWVSLASNKRWGRLFVRFRLKVIHPLVPRARRPLFVRNPDEAATVWAYIRTFIDTLSNPPMPLPAAGRTIDVNDELFFIPAGAHTLNRNVHRCTVIGINPPFTHASAPFRTVASLSEKDKVHAIAGISDNSNNNNKKGGQRVQARGMDPSTLLAAADTGVLNARLIRVNETLLNKGNAVTFYHTYWNTATPTGEIGPAPLSQYWIHYPAVMAVNSAKLVKYAPIKAEAVRQLAQMVQEEQEFDDFVDDFVMLSIDYDRDHRFDSDYIDLMPESEPNMQLHWQQFRSWQQFLAERQKKQQEKTGQSITMRQLPLVFREWFRQAVEERRLAQPEYRTYSAPEPRIELGDFINNWNAVLRGRQMTNPGAYQPIADEFSMPTQLRQWKNYLAMYMREYANGQQLTADERWRLFRAWVLIAVSKKADEHEPQQQKDVIAIDD